MFPSCRWSWNKSTKTSSKGCRWRSWSLCRKPWKGRSLRTTITVLLLPPWPQTLGNWTTGLPPVRSWRETTQWKSLIPLCDCSYQDFRICMATQAPSDSLLLERSLPRASSWEASLSLKSTPKGEFQKDPCRRPHAWAPCVIWKRLQVSWGVHVYGIFVFFPVVNSKQATSRLHGPFNEGLSLLWRKSNLCFYLRLWCKVF